MIRLGGANVAYSDMFKTLQEFSISKTSIKPCFDVGRASLFIIPCVSDPCPAQILEGAVLDCLTKGMHLPLGPWRITEVFFSVVCLIEITHTKPGPPINGMQSTKKPPALMTILNPRFTIETSKSPLW
jgi:hypothetical protein